MALHAPLTHFLARLDADLGAGTGGEFLAATGRHLVAGHILPEEEFSRTDGDYTTCNVLGLCKRLVRCILLIWLT
eukprot:COSAG02_NODE_22449_length_751_cov_1.131700_1_plen_75_part_00